MIFRRLQANVLLIFLLVLLYSFQAFSQISEQDSTIIRHSAHKATIYSAILPGLGQAYNKKYWKIPVIYAGFGTLGYFIHMNTDQYRKFKDAYNYVASGDTTYTSNPLVFKYSQGSLQQGRNYYRRNMELSYILSAALYFLNIIDAAVDAHLLEFDVGDNLSLRVQPAVIPPLQGEPLKGSLGLSLRF